MVGGGNPGLFGFGRSSATRMLESSDDGKTFTDVMEIETGGVAESTISFPPVTAKYFRVTIKTPESQGGPDPLGGLFGDLAALNRGPSGADVAEIVLHNEPRINHFEEKAGFSTLHWMPGSAGLVVFDGTPPEVPGALINTLRKQIEQINAAGGEILSASTRR